MDYIKDKMTLNIFSVTTPLVIQEHAKPKMQYSEIYNAHSLISFHFSLIKYCLKRNCGSTYILIPLSTYL